MPVYLTIFKGVIVSQVTLTAAPTTPPASTGLVIVEDTPQNRARHVAKVAAITPRQAAAAAMKSQPIEVRAAFATAWITINSLLDLDDTAGALAFFDALPIPENLQAQAAGIRALLAQI